MGLQSKAREDAVLLLRSSNEWVAEIGLAAPCRFRFRGDRSYARGAGSLYDVSSLGSLATPEVTSSSDDALDSETGLEYSMDVSDVLPTNARPVSCSSADAGAEIVADGEKDVGPFLSSKPVTASRSTWLVFSLAASSPTSIHSDDC